MTVPISFFTCPKAFTGEFERIQSNAIRSWKALGIEEIILLGDDDGVETFACTHELTWGGAVARNGYGTPLFDDLFHNGQAIAQTELVCYINSDILLFPDFLEAVEACVMQFDAFMMSGQRTNVEYGDLRFNDLTALLFQDRARHLGTREGVGAMDYFVFHKGSLGDIPPFALGRFRTDNWLLWRALDQGLPVIDATEALLAAHPRHGYHHQPEARELEYNDYLVSINGGVLGRLTDATHRLTADFHPVEAAKA